nr:retrovirus-related Pol polyprotein from transposon TNT 1-94 [Tanacetum cinerariifolium]
MADKATIVVGTKAMVASETGEGAGAPDWAPFKDLLNSLFFVLCVVPFIHNNVVRHHSQWHNSLSFGIGAARACSSSNSSGLAAGSSSQITMVTKFDIDKFDGKISFAIWKVHMQAVLMHHGYKKALRGIAHKPQSTSVQDHLDEFNTILIDLENLDVDIDDEDKAVLLVISLPASYKYFKEIMLYGNRKTLSFDDVKFALLSKQKYDDNVEPESDEWLFARGRSSEQGESSNKNKKHRSQSRGKYSNKSFKYCKKLGHIVSDCYKLKNKLEREGKGNNEKKPEKSVEVAIAKGDFDGDVYLSIDTEKSRDELIVDSGCTFHMIPHRSWFTTYESFNGGNVYMGNHSIYLVIRKGNIQVKMHDGVIRTITEVRHILDLKRNLISHSTLEANGCKYSSEGEVIKIFKGALVLMKAIQSGGLYVLQGTVVYGTARVATSKASLDDSKLWHYRLGHMGEKGMKNLAKKGLIKVLCNLEFCEHCVFGKQKRVSFSLGIHRTRDALDYIHSDLWGHLMLRLEEGKLVPRAVKCIFLDYSSGVKGYRVWCLDHKYRKIIHSRDVTFNEDVIINSGKDVVPPYNVDNNHTEGKVEFEFDVENSTHTQPLFNDEHDRERRQVNRPPRLEDYQFDLVAYAFIAAAHIENCEPTNYLEAISSPKCDNWVMAMEEEKDQVVLEDSPENLANKSIVTEHGLSSEFTQSPGGSSDTSEGSKNSESFEDSGRSDEEYSKDGASSKEGGFETPHKGRASPNGVVGYVDSDYAEYISSTEGVKAAIWLRGMVNKFGLPQELALLVFDTIWGAAKTTMKSYGFWFNVEIVGIVSQKL